MKSTKWLVILIAGAVVLSGLAGSFGQAKSKKMPAQTRSKFAASERKVGDDVLVTGYGETEQSARSNALRKAVEVVEASVNERLDGRRAIPARLMTPSYLEGMLVIAEEGKPEKDPEADNAIRARYKVSLNEGYLNTVASEARKEWIAEEKEERQDRVGDRHLTLARILGGVLAVLLVAAGYLRLEEATKGYYTTLLRAGAIGLLLAAAAGLVLTM